jgi:predicted dithiol-disulfide oxidoreductase (DUF899 family)
MRDEDKAAKLADYRRRIADLRREMLALRTGVEPEEVLDYAFATPQGPICLSDLFGPRRDLIVIHNMGASCPYCTLWADGYNGIYPHLAERAAFVVSSPDAPDVQQAFAAGRGWRFPMVSHLATTFAADMGYRSESGGWLPGVSVFKKDGVSCASLTRRALSVMIFARCGTSSTCCRKAPTGSGRSFVT